MGNAANVQLSAEDVEAALQEWSQGDVVLGSHIPLVHIADLRMPLTPASQELLEENGLADGPLAVIETNEIGCIVVSQTCDIVRSPKLRPFVDVCPVIRAPSEGVMREVGLGMRPRYAKIPTLQSERLIADLDRVVTVEKTLLAHVPAEARRRGCSTEDDLAGFARALARKRMRFAFPQPFVDAVAKIADRVQKKHGKETRDKDGRPTSEGSTYAALHEIRVHCDDWSRVSPETTLLFIFPKIAGIPKDAEDTFRELMNRFRPNAEFGVPPQSQVLALDAMSAELWLSTAPLDLDHLSGTGEGE